MRRPEHSLVFPADGLRAGLTLRCEPARSWLLSVAAGLTETAPASFRNSRVRRTALSSERNCPSNYRACEGRGTVRLDSAARPRVSLQRPPFRVALCALPT